MKIYSLELSYCTRCDIERAAAFKTFLENNNIAFECSACGLAPFDMVHFSIETEPGRIPEINTALDTLVYFDSIKGVR